MNTKIKDNQVSLQRLRELLECGRYPKDSRLPPERELSGELGISRAALRKALSVLEAENLIWRHVGRGTFVGRRPEAASGVQFGFYDATNPSEIMEVRMVLEPKMAALAALRATPGDIEKMHRVLLKSEATSDYMSFESWDEALHQAIADATGNSLLKSFFKAINSLRAGKIWGRLKEASLTPKNQAVYCRQHREVVEAVNDRDTTAAERMMRTHLETVQKNLLGNL